MFTYGFNPGREITHTKKKKTLLIWFLNLRIGGKKPKKALTGAIGEPTDICRAPFHVINRQAWEWL